MYFNGQPAVLEMDDVAALKSLRYEKIGDTWVVQLTMTLVPGPDPHPIAVRAVNAASSRMLYPEDGIHTTILQDSPPSPEPEVTATAPEPMLTPEPIPTPVEALAAPTPVASPEQPITSQEAFSLAIPEPSADTTPAEAPVPAPSKSTKTKATPAGTDSSVSGTSGTASVKEE